VVAAVDSNHLPPRQVGLSAVLTRVGGWAAHDELCGAAKPVHHVTCAHRHESDRRHRACNHVAQLPESPAR